MGGLGYVVAPLALGTAPASDPFLLGRNNSLLAEGGIKFPLRSYIYRLHILSFLL